MHSACSKSVTINNGYSATGGVTDVKDQSGRLSSSKSILMRLVTLLVLGMRRRNIRRQDT